ncbi:unnamed protein product [Oppiella nova]|nr:unnamed protein product [Oppiella nova]CAG2179074.1 unnamed protein product [Oppiella nova]
MGGLTHEITVRELLEGKHFSPAVTIEFISKPLKWFGIQMPDTHMPGNKFGLLNAVKESREGPHVCETGVGDSTFLKFVTFQGRTSYNMYDDPKCTVVNASDGRQLGPYKLTKDTVIWVPIGDLCRNFYIAYKEHSSVWGIPTWRYTLPPSMFASPKKNPANTCYCQTPDDPDMCDGIYEIGPCVYNLGIPISLSYPHFLYASDKIRTMVDGMYPDVDLHETQIDFEPTAGAPLRVRAGVQVNVKLEPSAYVV